MHVSDVSSWITACLCGWGVSSARSFHPHTNTVHHDFFDFVGVVWDWGIFLNWPHTDFLLCVHAVSMHVITRNFRLWLYMYTVPFIVIHHHLWILLISHRALDWQLNCLWTCLRNYALLMQKPVLMSGYGKAPSFTTMTKPTLLHVGWRILLLATLWGFWSLPVANYTSSWMTNITLRCSLDYQYTFLCGGWLMSMDDVLRSSLRWWVVLV